MAAQPRWGLTFHLRSFPESNSLLRLGQQRFVATFCVLPPDPHREIFGSLRWHAQMAGVHWARARPRAWWRRRWYVAGNYNKASRINAESRGGREAPARHREDPWQRSLWQDGPSAKSNLGCTR